MGLESAGWVDYCNKQELAIKVILGLPGGEHAAMWLSDLWNSKPRRAGVKASGRSRLKEARNEVWGQGQGSRQITLSQGLD